MIIRCKYDELVDVTALKPSPYQTNKHPKDQVERLAKILAYQGIRRPPTVSNLSGCLATGHGLVEAAKLNGWTQVPVQYQDFEDEDQERAHVTSDNSIALWAELDLALVNSMVPDFDPSFDIDLLGIKDFTLDVAEKHGDEDEVGEPPPEPVVKRGELWILGEHRLLIDDCTVKENVERLMAGEKADMVFTDPPYGIGYDSNHKSRSGRPNAHRAIANDDKILQLELPMVPTYLCSRWDVMSDWAKRLTENGLEVKNCIVWVKSNHSMGDLKGSYGSKWEAVLFAHSGEFEFSTGRDVDVWDIGQIYSGGYRHHPTEKTVKLPERAISNHPNANTVYDPFLGSGSTLIACEKTGRRCFGCEIDEHYAQVIIERFEKYSGKTAKREDGVTLAELKGVQVD